MVRQRAVLPPANSNRQEDREERTRIDESQCTEVRRGTGFSGEEQGAARKQRGDRQQRKNRATPNSQIDLGKNSGAHPVALDCRFTEVTDTKAILTDSYTRKARNSTARLPASLIEICDSAEAGCFGTFQSVHAAWMPGWLRDK